MVLQLTEAQFERIRCTERQPILMNAVEFLVERGKAGQTNSLEIAGDELSKCLETEEVTVE